MCLSVSETFPTQLTPLRLCIQNQELPVWGVHCDPSVQWDGQSQASSPFLCSFDLALKSQEGKAMHRVKTVSSPLLNQRLCCCLQGDLNQRFDGTFPLLMVCILQFSCCCLPPLCYEMTHEFLSSSSSLPHIWLPILIFCFPSDFLVNHEGGTFPGTEQPPK